MPNGFKKLAEGIGKTIESVPDVYDDGLKPATLESGKTLALIPRTVNAALVPLRQWIAEKEYNLAETEKLLAQKLENVSLEKIVTPEAYVAVPAIQAISYSMDSEKLRDLYANLLAKSMNIDTKDYVHPCFVEIIKQFSPTDASVLNFIGEREYLPCVGLVIEQYDEPLSDINSVFDLNLDPIQKVGYDNLTPITTIEYDSVLVSLDNLSRLGLIDKRYSFSTNETHPDIVASPIYSQIKSILQEKLVDESWKYNEYPTAYVLTNLGQRFYDNCAKSY